MLGAMLLQVGPLQEVVTLSARDVCRHAMPGRYVALYDGDGVLDFGMDAMVMARRRGRIDFAYNPTCNPACWSALQYTETNIVQIYSKYPK